MEKNNACTFDKRAVFKKIFWLGTGALLVLRSEMGDHTDYKVDSYFGDTLTHYVRLLHILFHKKIIERYNHDCWNKNKTVFGHDLDIFCAMGMIEI